uniref:Calcitonin n=1 Tax=Geotrypetes seraphini TaxID=260995 RepID=A0A6P8PRF4_GEOSA|nr:calcitonin [Geotrypetes seraphini]
MVILKISSLLAVFALVACQLPSSRATPYRAGSDSLADRVTLNDYQIGRLLNALMKELVRLTAEELEEGQGNSSDRPISKRCSNLSTCVLGRLSQDLHKMQNSPSTDVGAGSPGKKRNVLSDMENEHYSNYGESLPYN